MAVDINLMINTLTLQHKIDAVSLNGQFSFHLQSKELFFYNSVSIGSSITFCVTFMG